ncbi:MAG: hypothetical protein U1E15_11070 [Hyphomicrobiales bacterium]
MSDLNPLKLPVATLKKRRSPAIVRVLAWLMVLGIITAGAATLAAIWGYAAFTAPGPLKEAVVVNIPKGTSAMETARLLAEKGVVNDALVMGVGTLAQGFGVLRRKLENLNFPQP